MSYGVDSAIHIQARKRLAARVAKAAPHGWMIICSMTLRLQALTTLRLKIGLAKQVCRMASLMPFKSQWKRIVLMVLCSAQILSLKMNTEIMEAR